PSRGAGAGRAEDGHSPGRRPSGPPHPDGIPRPSASSIARPPPLVPFPPRGFLEGMGAVGEAIGMDLPEEDAAEALLHGPFGLDGDRFGVVVTDDDRPLGGDQPGILGLVVPAAGPALLALELVERAVVAPGQTSPRRTLGGRIRLGDGEAAAV